MMLAVVVIGRNEADRLRDCLGSLCSSRVVYVDSGSADESVALAGSFGVEVVELNTSQPFSAARARNEGFARVRELWPDAEYVQFVDGDCLVHEGWLPAAAGFLEEYPQYAVAAGRLRERYPERSIYNQLCDMEWNTPAGDVTACGGIAMFRVTAFEQAGGFNPAVIAGEEPELCLRLRAAGWRIRRLVDEMALHDAAMTRFGQWWKRAVRSGYAYALGNTMHGRGPVRHSAREIRSIWFWGLVAPALAVGLAWWSWWGSLVLFGGYLALGWRVYRYMRRRGFEAGDARLFAFFCVLAKWPQLQGVVRFWWEKLMATPAAVIEYKGVTAPVQERVSS